ncbi:hypothetical protein cyc_05440 [Cyclospora cayetanensis]|uniref:Uncharacterized protein n=1 Tax=Cyclospora cayetanensis TaxID=88456 RepID=A0A1D3CXI9_9EIME|nr:hypothetical protein cyc_05440 [Cyclospora cayetanensis]
MERRLRMSPFVPGFTSTRGAFNPMAPVASARPLAGHAQTTVTQDRLKRREHNGARHPKTGTSTDILNGDEISRRSMSWRPGWNDRIPEPPVSDLTHATFSAVPRDTVLGKRDNGIRPSSVGPPRRYAQISSINRMQARSVDIRAQRRLMHGQQAMVSNKNRFDKDFRSDGRSIKGKAPRMSTYVQSSSSTISEENPKSRTLLDATSSEIPHLRKRRTWEILQHLVDQIEQGGNEEEGPSSETLLQHPDILQKLLHAIRPLIPLKDVIGQLAEKEEIANAAQPTQGGAPPALCCESGGNSATTRISSVACVEPRSKSARRRAPASATGHKEVTISNASVGEQRSSLPRRPLASPGPVHPTAVNQGTDRLPAGWKPTRLPAATGGLVYGRPASTLRNPLEPTRSAFPTGDRLAAVSSSAKNYNGTAQLEGSTKRYEKPRTTRSASTGRYMHVASRLPQGALEHKRPQGTRTKVVSINRSTEKQRQLTTSSEGSGFSADYADALVPEPFSSARSGDTDCSLALEATASRGCRLLGLGEDEKAQRVDLQGGTVRCAVPPSLPGVRFASIQALGTSPPASHHSYSESKESGRSDASDLHETQGRGSVISTGPRQHAEPEAESATASVASTSPHRGSQMLVERSPVTPRRRASATPTPTRPISEKERFTRRSVHSHEGLLSSPPKRERYLTVAEASRGRLASVSAKIGRTVDAGDAESDKESVSHGSSPVPRLKQRGREARTASIQVASPRGVLPLSPTSKKTRPERPPALGKATTERDQKSPVKSPRASPRDAPHSAASTGRRLLGSSSRKALQPKFAPGTPPRARANSAMLAPGQVTAKGPRARRKSVKASPEKQRTQSSRAAKNEKQQPEAKESSEKSEEADEAPQEEMPPPESAYPYLRIAELPMLDKPLRHFPELETLPLKPSPEPPPQIDDSITFLHVMERSEGLTEEARDKATHRAVSSLCSDGPDTMMLIARWMDKAADALESNSIAVKEDLPWWHVIPPLFVGLQTHRNLLDPEVPSRPITLDDLRNFLREEGLFETDEQKLRRLLQAEGPSSKLLGGSRGPKTPTPLDNYMDYLLEVALKYLRMRQKPLVIPKITRFTTIRKNYPGRRAVSLATETVHLPKGGVGAPCHSMTGPPELDLFESTAIQHVRESLCKMPLLPSEKYLRYLRSTGRCNELRSLAIWLAGSYEMVLSYNAFLALRMPHVADQIQTSSSNQDAHSHLSSSRSESRTSGDTSGRSSLGRTRKPEDKGPRSSLQEHDAMDEKLETITEGTEEYKQHEQKDEENSQRSSLSVSLYSSPRTPALHAVVIKPSSSISFDSSCDEQAPDHKDEKCPGLHVLGETSAPSPIKGQHLTKITGKSRIVSVPKKLKNSGSLPASPRYYSSSRSPPAEPSRPRRSSSMATALTQHPSHQSTAPATKVKPKKVLKIKAGFIPAEPTGQKASAEEKHFRIGLIQEQQAPVAPEGPAFARDKHISGVILHPHQGSLSDGRDNTCELSGSAGVPFESSVEGSAAHMQGRPALRSLNGVPTQSYKDTAVSGMSKQRAGSVLKQARVKPQSVRGRIGGKSNAVAVAGVSPKPFHAISHAVRYPGARSQNKIDGTLCKTIRVKSSRRGPSRVIQEAVDLLSEPQMLAEVANLCTRLSSLICCHPSAPLLEHHSNGPLHVEDLPESMTPKRMVRR